MFVANGTTSVTMSLGGVSAGQLVLVGLEFDPNTPSYRVWANGSVVGAPAFAAGCTATASFVSSNSSQGGWPFYFGAYLWGPDWDTQVATMEQWVVDSEFVLTPLSAP